jgi:uncharacterized protein YbjT (DUF2867 family)
MGPRVTVVGGTGFIGRRLVARLAARGAWLRVVSRHACDVASSSRLEHILGSIEDRAIVERAVDGVAVLVNLVGTTTAKSAQAFYALHRDAPQRLAQAAQRSGVERFVQVSAMGVAIDAPSFADRSKAAGERAVRDAFPGAIIIRPALVYGLDDHFFSTFAPLARRALAIPLIGGGRTRFQPMHVDDVTDAMARLIEARYADGRVYELGADEVFTFRELIERLCDALGRRPWLVPVPFALAEAGARVTQWLPNAPLTADQVRLLMTDKVIRDPQCAPAALGVRPRPLDAFLAELGARERH